MIPTTKRYYYICRWCKQEVDIDKRLEHNRQMEHRAKEKKHAPIHP